MKKKPNSIRSLRNLISWYYIASTISFCCKKKSGRIFDWYDTGTLWDLRLSFIVHHYFVRIYKLYPVLINKWEFRKNLSLRIIFFLIQNYRTLCFSCFVSICTNIWYFFKLCLCFNFIFKLQLYFVVIGHTCMFWKRRFVV